MDTKTNFELHPYIGAGQIGFGMTQSEVSNALGPPDQVSKNFLKQKIEHRSFMALGYSPESGGVIHIGFGRQMEGIRYKDIFIFQGQEKTVLQELVDEDGGPYIYMGFIVLLRLGITLTGFHDEDISQRALSMFAHGAWDSRIPKMKPFV